MDAFEVHRRLIADYREFTEGFVQVRDPRVAEVVARESERGSQWPDPWLSLNPSFASGGRIDELVGAGLLDPECDRIFRVKPGLDDLGTTPLTLHQHQREAIEVAARRESYVLTTGTGSGKSLAYIVPIVDRVLKRGTGRGVQAIVVYPMNALANSQMEELGKFLEHGYGGRPPVTFARYTGQEHPGRRQEILANPPDILLTNYVMLELVLTRPDERSSLVKAAKGLQFLVLDELHTYRGRQGADVAMLVRRVREACEAQDSLVCVGTSATMSSGGTVAQQRQDVAAVATRIFGATVSPGNVITETLVRATSDRSPTAAALAEAVRARGDAEAIDPALRAGYANLAGDPLASWIEDTFGVTEEEESGRLIRRPPTTVDQAAVDLSELTGAPETAAATAIRATLLAGSRTKDADGSQPVRLPAASVHLQGRLGLRHRRAVGHPGDRHGLPGGPSRVPGAAAVPAGVLPGVRPGVPDGHPHRGHGWLRRPGGPAWDVPARRPGRPGRRLPVRVGCTTRGPVTRWPSPACPRRGGPRPHRAEGGDRPTEEPSGPRAGRPDGRLAEETADSGRGHVGRVDPGRLQVLPELRGVLRVDPLGRVGEAGHLGQGGPQLGDDGARVEHRDQPANLRRVRVGP